MRQVITGAEAASPTGSPARSAARRSRHQRSWSGLPFESSPFSWSGRRFDSPQPSRSGVLTSRLYELTLDAPPNQELLFVPAKSSKKTARALKVDGDSETYEEPSSPGWAELKAQCERMEEEDRRITSIDLTHIPESDTEADSHGLHGSRRRRGKDADGVVMYGLGWQPSRDVERSNGPDHEVEIEVLPQRRVLQPTYSLSDQQPSNAFTGQQPTCTTTGLGYDCGEGERIAGTQSSRGRTSPGVQQEARVLNPIGSRLNPHFKPCQPGPPQQGASDDSAASASLSESSHRLQGPSHEEQPPCQPCQVPPGQGWPGQGPFGEGAFEQLSCRFKAPPGNVSERWQQVMEERVREAFAMGYLAGLRDAAAHSVAPPAAAPAAAAAAGASPGRFVPKKISSDSHYVTSHSREEAAPRMCKSSMVSGISHCQDRSPLRWTREVRMPLESIHQSSTVSGGGSHSKGGSPLGWKGEGEVHMPHRSHACPKGPLQARRVASGPLQPRSGPLQPQHGLLEPPFGPLQPWAGLLQPWSDVLQPRSGPLQPRTDLQQSQQPSIGQPNRENCRSSTSRGDSAGCASVHAEGTRSARIPLNQLQPQQAQPQQQQVGEQQQQEQAQVEGEQQQHQKQQAVEQQQQEQQEEGWRQRWRRVQHRRSGSLGAWQELPCRAGEEEGSVRALAFHSAARFEFERSLDEESDADSCRSPGGGGTVGVRGVRTGASCTGLRLSRRLFPGRLLLTPDSS
ncbi:unnamed protein product [Closterium sp. Naga37s-1]|nr:unnamed protein product [Closterium sp. Naga37s-1]